MIREKHCPCFTVCCSCSYSLLIILFSYYFNVFISIFYSDLLFNFVFPVFKFWGIILNFSGWINFFKSLSKSTFHDCRFSCFKVLSKLINDSCRLVSFRAENLSLNERFLTLSDRCSGRILLRHIVFKFIDVRLHKFSFR